MVLEKYFLPGALASEHLERLTARDGQSTVGFFTGTREYSDSQLLLVPSLVISTDRVASQLEYLLPSCLWVIPTLQVFSACSLTLKIIAMFSSLVSAISQVCVLLELSGSVNEGEIKFTFSAIGIRIL